MLECFLPAMFCNIWWVPESKAQETYRNLTATKKLSPWHLTVDDDVMLFLFLAYRALITKVSRVWIACLKMRVAVPVVYGEQSWNWEHMKKQWSINFSFLLIQIPIVIVFYLWSTRAFTLVRLRFQSNEVSLLIYCNFPWFCLSYFAWYVGSFSFCVQSCLISCWWENGDYCFYQKICMFVYCFKLTPQVWDWFSG